MFEFFRHPRALSSRIAAGGYPAVWLAPFLLYTFVSLVSDVFRYEMGLDFYGDGSRPIFVDTVAACSWFFLGFPAALHLVARSASIGYRPYRSIVALAAVPEALAESVRLCGFTVILGYGADGAYALPVAIAKYAANALTMASLIYLFGGVVATTRAGRWRSIGILVASFVLFAIPIVLLAVVAESYGY